MRSEWQTDMSFPLKHRVQRMIKKGDEPSTRQLASSALAFSNEFVLLPFDVTPK